MKKFISLMLCVVLVTSLVACGGGSSASSGGATKKSVYKIGMVTDVGGVNDQSFNQSSWEGLKQLGDTDPTFETRYLESKTDADYANNIKTFVDEGYDLIICVGYMLANAVAEASEEYPDTKFVLVDDVIPNARDNVACLTFKQEECSYLVGVVAAMMTKKDNIGFVQGMVSDSMNRFGIGYVAGAKSINPDIVVQQQNANTFAESATGATIANQMYSNGADVIYHAAGGTGAGVINSCHTNGIYAIGVDSDQSYISPDTVITSAVKLVGVAAVDISKSLANGTFRGGEHVYDLSNGGVDIAPTKTLLTPEVISKVEEVKKDIIAGKIKVPSTKAECPDFTLG